MIKALVTDVSYVLLKPKDPTYKGSLNALYKENKERADFKFFEYFELNESLLNYYKSLKDNLKIYILTSDVIQDDKALQPYWNAVIDEIYSASKMNTYKSKPEAYELVVDKIGLKPEEIIYVDDNEDNIKVSTSVGLNSILHTENNQTTSKVNSLLL